jgi:hypothetical protein
LYQLQAISGSVASTIMAQPAERVRASEGKKTELGVLRFGLSVLLLAAIAAVVLVLAPPSVVYCEAETSVGKKGPGEMTNGMMSLRKL